MGGCWVEGCLSVLFFATQGGAQLFHGLLICRSRGDDGLPRLLLLSRANYKKQTPMKCAPCVQGDVVAIPKGWNLVIDVTTPRLKELWVDGGNVTVAPEGATVQTGYLIIRNGGSLSAGSAFSPFLGNFHVLLHGQKDSPVKAWTEELMLGSKVLAVVNGSLNLYGAPRSRALALAADAAAGADSLELAKEPLGWHVGDAVVVTSTDFNPDGEEFTIRAVAGRTVALSAALKRSHTARRWIDPRGTHNVDMRARVLNLASNIIIAADDGELQWAAGSVTVGGKFGAHVVVGDLGRAELSSIAVRHCGQYGELRGCVKFQTSAATAGSFLKDSATAYGV
jgi:hypothetical protein